MFKKTRGGLILIVMMWTLTFAAQAASHDHQHRIRLAQVNWTGVTVKTATAAWILEQLGYRTKVDTLSIPVVLRALANDDADLFFGLWIPSQRTMARKYLQKGKIDIVTRNLKGGKYTVAVNRKAWDAGVHDFKDLARHGDRFDHRIYGIEAGNEGNGFIKDMIQDDAYGLHDFELKPSNESVMLTQVQRLIKKGKWAAWLAWSPHPMTINIDMKFLEGGEKYFGPKQGAAAVYSLASSGYAWKHPNVGQFVENYHYTVDEQSKIANYVVTDDMKPLEAGLKLLRDKPKLLDRWLGQGGTYQTDPVQTVDGRDGRKAVQEALEKRQ